MPNQKKTIARDSVFGGLGGQPGTTPVAEQQQGIEPAVSPTRQTAVWLADEEVEWLDEKIKEVKRGGWRNLSRSALIRALIRSAMAHNPELAGIASEDELIRRLLSR